MNISTRFGTDGDGNFQVLWEDADRVFCRAWRREADGSRHAVLVVRPAAEHPAPATLDRLAHEYGLKDALNGSWAVRPLALDQERGRTLLVLEDPGSEPLDRLLGAPLEVGRFLVLALGIAVALGKVHRAGLVHRDVKPANILVNSAGGEVRFTGFGVASRLPRERQAPEPPETIAGTLAYMAPEQTGRMNRSVDARSDLYALGITFYQMLTGTLPFTASDPMELVHCHIARKPIPPAERVGNVPATVSAIVMKLLAKTAEERYQTASGLEHDLRRYLADWKAAGRLGDFPLGAQDVPDRLLIPEKLYGRAGEVETLLAAFDRIAQDGTPELVLVSGYAGIGKSAVVNELHKALVPPRGLFASGKFDQYKRDIPYATLAQAFQSLIRPLLGKSDAELTLWRDAFREALGPNGQLMVDLVPELRLIIGEQPPVPEHPPRDAQRRFQMVFRRFVGVFARPEHPLVLFLDDLQWLDAATLDLLEHLAAQFELRHLLLVGAYRDNEVTPAHPLMRRLAAIRSAGGRVQEIVLTPLGLEAVGRLIADTLHGTPERVAPLALLVYEKTAGNPFFTIQFLSALADEGLLAAAQAEEGGLAAEPGEGRWSWDLGRIRAKGYTDNVVELMLGKLRRLSAATQDALQLLACLGNGAAIRTLALVRGGGEAALDAALWEAVQAGLVLRLEGSYRFLHDRVQEAAYALIPEGERAAAHLAVGRVLAAQMPPEAIEENVFEILSQFNRGATLIIAAEEREKVAELNLIAGRRAKQSTAYASALTYLIAGRALLPEDAWERRYELSFALELNRAECDFVTGALAAAEDRLSMLSGRAERLVDLAAVSRLRLEILVTLGQIDDALKVGRSYLRRAGVTWPVQLTPEAVRREYKRIWRRLGGRPIEALRDLPLMTDPVACGTMDVLIALVGSAYFADHNLYRLIIGRLANLSLEHGNSDASGYAYTLLGTVLGGGFGEYEAAFRFGQLGLDLVEQRGFSRYKARVYMNFGTQVNPWMRPIRTGRPQLKRVFDMALQAGDVTYAAFTCNCLVTHFLASGDPLADVQREAEAGLDFAGQVQFGLVIDLLTAQRQMVRTLRGLTPIFGCFNDAGFDEGRFEQHLEQASRLKLSTCWYWIRKLQASVLADDRAAAIAAAVQAERYIWVSPGFLERAEYEFYAALARAALCDAASPTERALHLEALGAHHRQLRLWAENCPENFENRAALADAEIARIEGRVLDAEHLYEQAIRSARANGFVHHEAIASEVAARFYAARGFETNSQAHLRIARRCYLRWGAEGKVRQLEHAHPWLREEAAPLLSTATLGATVEQLELAAVVRAAQAVSGEILLDRLIQTLMTLALEHAGAERGLLIVLRGDVPEVVAKARTDHKTVDVSCRQAAVSPSEMPETLLRTVLRTQESVILDDAMAANPFAADAYFQGQRVRSVLCLPLLKQAELIGLLYLENNLASHAFTPARITVLELLAAQAAISLENARLYADLLRENRERQMAEKALRRSETYLAEAQRLSRTGSFGWHVARGDVFWSEESFKIFGYDKAPSANIEMVLQRIHPGDRALAQRSIDHASRTGEDFDVEHRLLLPDGTIRYVHAVGRAVRDQAGELEFIGSVMDVTAAKRALESLQKAHADLAHAARMTTLGELAASIAHEINQPLAAVATNGDAGLRWLGRNPPELDEARQAIARIVQNAHRAGNVIRSLRALAVKSEPQFTPLDLNDAIQEVLALIRSELHRHDVALYTELFAPLPSVLGDKVQLQQVLLNLITNGMDAMAEVTDRPKMLTLIAQPAQPDGVRVAVADTGIGFDPAAADQIFAPFCTTKSSGMGMGLSICRTIIEAHGGQLWAGPNLPQGAIFQFQLPADGKVRS